MTSLASEYAVRGAITQSGAAKMISDLKSNGRRNCTVRFRSFETRLGRDPRRSTRLTFGFQAVRHAAICGGCKPIPERRVRTVVCTINSKEPRAEFRRFLGLDSGLIT